MQPKRKGRRHRLTQLSVRLISVEFFVLSGIIADQGSAQAPEKPRSETVEPSSTAGWHAPRSRGHADSR